MPANSVDGNFTVFGVLKADSIDSATQVSRTSLRTDTATFALSPFLWRIWDAPQTALGTASSDDLGLYIAVWATSYPHIRTSDSTGGNLTQRARCFFQLPWTYVAGEAVSLNFSAGMNGTVASSAATLDAEVFECLRTGLITGSDLVTTAATSINSTSASEVPFVITPTTLAPGDFLDVRVTIATTNVTAAAIFGCIFNSELKCSVKG